MSFDIRRKEKKNLWNRLIRYRHRHLAYKYYSGTNWFHATHFMFSNVYMHMYLSNECRVTEPGIQCDFYANQPNVLTRLSAELIRGTRLWAPRRCNCDRAISHGDETGCETTTLLTKLYGCWPSPWRIKRIHN